MSLKLNEEVRARERGLGVIGVEGTIKTQSLDGMTLANIKQPHSASYSCLSLEFVSPARLDIL